MPVTPYAGSGTIVPLDYGHSGYPPEHSVLLVPDNWSSLVELLQYPFDFLVDAKLRFGKHVSTNPFSWDSVGPMTIILEPLTNLTRQNAESLHALALAAEIRSPGNPHYNAMANALRALIPQWKTKTPEKWRGDLIKACTFPDGMVTKCKGYFLVEYALYTRVIVIRYIPPSPAPPPIYMDVVTAVTFSDFLSTKPFPRPALMHFDLKSGVDQNGTYPPYTHASVARLKAQFVVDYVSDPKATLERLCDPNGQKLIKGLAKYAYSYCAASFARVPNKLIMQAQANAEASTVFDVVDNLRKVNVKKPTSDPTVIMESVDPWADGRVWTDKPRTGKFSKPPSTPTDDAPHPCILIWVVVDGVGSWQLDLQSTLAKNYVAPSTNSGPPNQ